MHFNYMNYIIDSRTNHEQYKKCKINFSESFHFSF